MSKGKISGISANKAVAQHTVSGGKLRAKERVLAYLNAEFAKGDMTKGARLPTSRALSKQLGVSVSTVQAVFSNLSGKGIISTEVGNGSFLLNPPETTAKTLRIGVTFGVLEGNSAADFWQLGISGAILNHCATMEGEVSIIPIPLANQTAAEALETLKKYRGRVDGVILRPIADLDESVEEQLGFPVVHLNPPGVSSTRNFVSADFYAGCRKLGEALKAGERRRWVNLENALGIRNSASASLRHAGLLAALGPAISREVHYEMFEAQGHLEENGYAAAESLFAPGSPRPDAIVAGGDLLALGVWRYCREHGISVPQEVCLIGGAGTETGHPDETQLTRTLQPLQLIGEQLVDMLCERIHGEGRAVPGIYLPMLFSTGSTTATRENSFLKANR